MRPLTSGVFAAEKMTSESFSQGFQASEVTIAEEDRGHFLSSEGGTVELLSEDSTIE